MSVGNRTDITIHHQFQDTCRTKRFYGQFRLDFSSGNLPTLMARRCGNCLENSLSIVKLRRETYDGATEIENLVLSRHLSGNLEMGIPDGLLTGENVLMRVMQQGL